MATMWIVNNKLELISFSTDFTVFCSNYFKTKPRFKQSVFQVLPPGSDIAEDWRKRYEKALRGDSMVYTDTFHHQGQEFTYELQYFPIKRPHSKQIEGVSTMAKDITENFRLVSKIQSIENKNQVIINAIPDIIFVNDIEGNYTDVIRGKYSTDTHHHKTVIGKNISDYLSREDTENLLFVFNDVVKNDFLGEVEYKLYLDGQYSYFEARVVKLSHYQVISFVKDITTQKLRQKQIALQNKKLKALNEELDSIVYKASHDLRSPLTSMMGLIYLLKFEKEEEIREKSILALEKSVNRLDSFIQEIIDLSKSKHKKINIEKVDFTSMVKNIFENIAHIEHKTHVRKNVSVNIEADFYTDVKKLDIILSNLIGNAIKYSKPDFEASYVNIYIKRAKEDKTLTILIADNGIGIDGKYLNHIFDMFYRANDVEAGSGLGLYIVKEGIKKLGGKIMVKSKLYAGTKFKVILPSLEKTGQGMGKANQMENKSYTQRT